MQNENEVTPLEFLVSTAHAPVKSPRRSPRFKVETDTMKNPLQKRMSLPFSEMRANERRDTANPLHERVFSVEQSQLQGRIRRNSIIWPVKEDPQYEFDRKLSETLYYWKLMKEHTSANASIVKAIEDGLGLLEKSYAEGILQYSDPSKPEEKGITYSLLSLLDAMYKCPASQIVLLENEAVRKHFCSVNFMIRDYKSILEEAILLLKMVKKSGESIECILTHLTKMQIKVVEEFAFVPFVRGIFMTNNVQDIFKSGILKDRDIYPFYQRLRMRKFTGLDSDVAKVKMVDLIVHPETLQMVYGPLALPMKTILTKEALLPLKNIVNILSHLELNLAMFISDEFEIKINLAINPMGKIKEKIQMFVEELTNRLMGDFIPVEQAHYQEMLHNIFPPVQVGKRRNWLRAFEMLHELATKIKQLPTQK